MIWLDILGPYIPLAQHPSSYQLIHDKFVDYRKTSTSFFSLLFQVVLYDIMMEREQSGEEWEGLGLEYRQGSTAANY